MKKVNPDDYKMALGPLKPGQRVIALTSSGIVKYRGVIILYDGELFVKRDDNKKRYWEQDKPGWKIHKKYGTGYNPDGSVNLNKLKWNPNDGIYRNELYFEEVTNWKEYFEG